jgi:N-acetylmuramoyl-L-alanine amidase CwlA
VRNFGVNSSELDVEKFYQQKGKEIPARITNSDQKVKAGNKKTKQSSKMKATKDSITNVAMVNEPEVSYQAPKISNQQNLFE